MQRDCINSLRSRDRSPYTSWGHQMNRKILCPPSCLGDVLIVKTGRKCIDDDRSLYYLSVSQPTTLLPVRWAFISGHVVQMWGHMIAKYILFTWINAWFESHAWVFCSSKHNFNQIWLFLLGEIIIHLHDEFSFDISHPTLSQSCSHECINK